MGSSFSRIGTSAAMKNGNVIEIGGPLRPKKQFSEITKMTVTHASCVSVYRRTCCTHLSSRDGGRSDNPREKVIS